MFDRGRRNPLTKIVHLNCQADNSTLKFTKLIISSSFLIFIVTQLPLYYYCKMCNLLLFIKGRNNGKIYLFEDNKFGIWSRQIFNHNPQSIVFRLAPDLTLMAGQEWTVISVTTSSINFKILLITIGFVARNKKYT